MKTETELLDEARVFVRETFESVGGPMPSEEGVEYAARKICASLMATLEHANAEMKRESVA